MLLPSTYQLTWRLQLKSAAQPLSTSNSPRHWKCTHRTLLVLRLVYWSFFLQSLHILHRAPWKLAEIEQGFNVFFEHLYTLLHILSGNCVGQAIVSEIGQGGFKVRLDLWGGHDAHWLPKEFGVPEKVELWIFMELVKNVHLLEGFGCHLVHFIAATDGFLDISMQKNGF